MNAFTMSIGELARAVGGAVSGGSASLLVKGVSTDSRQIRPGQLFVALRGEHFDGHDYLASVARAGAAAAVVSASIESVNLPQIIVADTGQALGDMASAWRRRFSLPLIGVTGSNGKTTTKEMLAAILRAEQALCGQPEGAVVATSGNLNNDIGVPLMLLRVSEGTRAAVIEMGMSHPGEISRLAGWAAPTVGLVTNAQRAHLEGLGSLEGVAREKGSLYTRIAADGVAVINANDAHASLWREMAAGRRIVNASLLTAGSVAPEGVEVIAERRTATKGTVLKLTTPQGQVDIRLATLGEHNARNAVLAAAAAMAAGSSLAAVKDGLEGFVGVQGRLTPRAGKQGARIIDDSYNANPDSVRAAIAVLAACSGRRILVLGDMGEVGNARLAVHAEVGDAAREAGIDALYALGEASLKTCDAFGKSARHFTTHAELTAAISRELAPQTTVLVKGSRFMRMEKIADALASPEQEAD